MKKHYIFLILTLNICAQGVAQEESLYYEKGLSLALDSLVKEIPKVKFFLTNEYPILTNAKDPFGGLTCNIYFDDLKQKGELTTKIIIPNKYKNRYKRNNFFNRLIFGNNLVAVTILVLYEDSEGTVFSANVNKNEDGILIFFKFKSNSLEVDEFCKEYSIY